MNAQNARFAETACRSPLSLLSGFGLRWGMYLGLGLAIAAAPLADVSFAQSPSAETAEETVWGTETVDPLGGSPGGMLELMRRLNQGSGQSWEEFQMSQQENLSSEANDFRARQLQLLNGQTAAPTANPRLLSPAPLSPDAASDTELQSSAPEPYRALW